MSELKIEEFNSKVNWFPGHMTKAIRLIEKNLSSIDLIIECRDSRIPYSSHNPLIDDWCLHKPLLIVLTKRDLANQDNLNQFIQNCHYPCISVNNNKDNVARKLVEGVNQAMESKLLKLKQKGIKNYKTKALIVGVPNVGKSSVINRSALKNVVNVANKPGVTQALKNIVINDYLELVDTPGLLWPKFETIEQGYFLSLCLSVKETGFNVEDIINFGLNKLFDSHLVNNIKNYYQITELNLEAILFKLMNEQKKDKETALMMILRDIQNNRFGRFSWE